MQPKVEHILCYIKGINARFNLNQVGTKDYPEKDHQGRFRYALIEQMNFKGVRGRESMVFPILGIKPKSGKQWQIGLQKMEQYNRRGDLLKKDGGVYMKQLPTDEREAITDPFWAFFSKKIGTAESAKKELTSILGSGHAFETVKPTNMIHRLLFHATHSDAIVLDSFAGSGTTAHATLALNKEDGGNRKFILVECEDYADKITAERVRRVIKGVPGAKDEKLKKGCGGDFTYCTLGTSKEHHVWLIYKPDLQFLQSSEAALTLDKTKEIAKSKRGKKRHLVFAPATFVSQKTLHGANNPVNYQPLPWSLYRVAGS